MKKTEMTIETPRGTFKIHSVYSTMEKARNDGWGLWFQHDTFVILARDNRVGAVVLLRADQAAQPER